MTFLTAVQGRNCALFVSDLQLLFIPTEQIHLPDEQRQAIKYVAIKFRPNLYGDPISFHGRMNPDELALFHKASLKKLENKGLNDKRFRDDNVAVLYYGKKSTAQIYHGTSDSKLVPLQVGQVSATCTTHEYAVELLNKLRENVTKQEKLNSDAMRKLSDIVQEYYLDKERYVNTFGGFASYILKPGEYSIYRKIPGKLEGVNEAEVKP